MTIGNGSGVTAGNNLPLNAKSCVMWSRTFQTVFVRLWKIAANEGGAIEGSRAEPKVQSRGSPVIPQSCTKREMALRASQACCGKRMTWTRVVDIEETERKKDVLSGSRGLEHSRKSRVACEWFGDNAP